MNIELGGSAGRQGEEWSLEDVFRGPLICL